MREDAAQIRELYVKKTVGKGNVAIAEVHLQENVVFCAGGTSRAKSPTPLPKPKSEGGQFEPTIDSRFCPGRLMDTDAEYKVLSSIADTLETCYGIQVKGSLYLYTELQPCESCNNVLRQFREKFPNISVEVFWDYPWP